MRIAKETQVLALVIGTQLASAAAAFALPPDYLLLKRCISTMDERRPLSGQQWQISSSFVAIQLANGTGGHPARHSFAFDTYAFCNGPNGYAEYGTGDDVCMGPASQLPGTLVYSAVTSAPDAASGNFSLTESPSGNYTNSLNVTATMVPQFNFVGATSITLSYYHHHAFLWTSAIDVGRVEVSTDGGINWNAIRSHTYYLGDFGQFKRADANLSAYAGNPTIRIRFRFTSDATSTDNGWNIDDVRLVVDGSTEFFDDFESGTGQWTLQAPWGLSLAANTFSALGSINAAGLYTTTPVTNPVSVGEGMGFAAIRAQYTEGAVVHNVHTQIHHTAPQWKLVDLLGYENLCPMTGNCATSGVEEPVEAPAQHVILEQNSPNPFNPSTDIRFLLPDDAPVSLRIYDQAGRVVRVLLANQVFPAGEHFATWNGLDDHGQAARSGVYFYELNVGGREHTRKMVLVK